MRTLRAEFACTLAQTPQFIELEYTLKNHEPLAIGVFNHVVDYEIDGTWIVSPDTVYIDLEGSVLSVSKGPLEAPKDLDMYANTPPYVSTLSPGASLSERIHIPLPARVMHPFKCLLLPGQAVADHPARASSLRFSVAAFPIESDLSLVAPHPAWPRILQVSPSGRAVSAKQVFSREFALAAPADVLDYRSVPRHAY